MVVGCKENFNEYGSMQIWCGPDHLKNKRIFKVATRIIKYVWLNKYILCIKIKIIIPFTTKLSEYTHVWVIYYKYYLFIYEQIILLKRLLLDSSHGNIWNISVC